MQKKSYVKGGGFMPGDLHTHTTCSDGSAPLAKLPFLARAAGLTALAISDHDSLQSVHYAQQNPTVEGVNLIPATELSAFDFERVRRVHLLCYWPDDCAELAQHCRFMAEGRNAAVLQSCHELEEICPQFRTEEALAYAKDSGVLFKAHIMRVLLDDGLVDSIYGDTYHELFGSKPGQGRILHKPAYHSVSEVLAVIHAARGVAVFAHPSVYHSMELVGQLARAGQIDGVEIDHPRNTPEDRAVLQKLAQECNLITTGGTDFHGMNTQNPHPVGTCRTEDEAIARLAALAKKRKQEY